MENKIKKIGIFGGSFNPIHNGHIQMAELAVSELGLDILYLIPLGTPSHRENHGFASGEERLEMVKLACEENKKIVPCDYEIKTTEVSYTYDTLLEIMKNHPNDEIFEVVGEDSAEYLDEWKNYEEMKTLCKFVSFQREGYQTKLEGIQTIKAPLFNISSTQIRENIEKNKNLDGLLPKNIISYINRNNLYRK